MLTLPRNVRLRLPTLSRHEGPPQVKLEASSDSLSQSKVSNDFIFYDNVPFNCHKNAFDNFALKLLFFLNSRSVRSVLIPETWMRSSRTNLSITSSKSVSSSGKSSTLSFTSSSTSVTRSVSSSSAEPSSDTDSSKSDSKSQVIRFF